MVKGRGFGDVGENGATEDDIVLDALADEVWQVDGGIYADGFKGSASVAAGWEGGFGKDSKLGLVSLVVELSSAHQRYKR